jgi:hypothetical protein
MAEEDVINLHLFDYLQVLSTLHLPRTYTGSLYVEIVVICLLMYIL